MPEGTALTPLNPMPEDVANEADYVRPWDELNDDEKRLFSRFAEVYAGFSEYTDAQVGRIVDYLEETGQLDNTLIFYCADNGASGEGSPNGSVNENKFFNGYPDDLAENLAMLDKLGSPDTYNHYPTGWAAAFSTPFQMFKRYAQFSGGTCDPMVIHWPKGIEAQRRAPPPVPPLHRHRGHRARRHRPRDARGLPGRGAAPAERRLDALQLRRRSPTARRRRRCSTTRCSAPAGSGRTAGRRPRSMLRSAARATSTRTRGSSTTSPRTGRSRRTWRPRCRRSCRS